VNVSLSIIKGCVPVDVSVYDIPKRLKDGGSVAAATFSKTFGEKEEAQRDYSPVAHENLEQDQALIRSGLVNILTGKAALPIVAQSASDEEANEQAELRRSGADRAVG
jgi:hypothetical protein